MVMRTVILFLLASLIGLGCSKPVEETIFYKSESLAFWIKQLRDIDTVTKKKALAAIHAMGPKAEKAVPALIEALKNKDLLVILLAARALGEIGPKAEKAVPALIETLKDKDLNVRGSAVRALGKIGPKAEKAVPALIEVFMDKDEEENVRKAAQEALKKIQKK
jgi:HEAT repeat protein